MDRKGWLVVILCAAGLVWTFLDMTKRQQLAQQARQAEAAAAARATAEKQTASAASPDASVDPATGKPAETATPPAPAETHELRSTRAGFHFSSKGGLATIEALTESGNEGEHLVLNEHGAMPVGGLAQAPVLNSTGVPVRAPEARNYKFVHKGAKQIIMEAKDESGLLVRKTFRLEDSKDPNLLVYTLSFENTGAETVNVNGSSVYVGGMGKIRPADIEPPSFFWNDNGDADKFNTGSFQGGWFSDARPEIITHAGQLRWTGVMDRYNAIIVSPSERAKGAVWSQPGSYIVGGVTVPMVSAGIALDDFALVAGAKKEFSYEIYTGAKEYRRLVNLGDDRRKVMFYGWFSPISRLMVNLMTMFWKWTTSWGWAIVLMTIVIRLCLYPLMAGSQRSMKRMAGMQEDMKKVREKYKEDPRRMQMETMALYKKHGVNPLAGCLPILIQIPIFFGFFAVINHAAELRGEPFLWWVKDLSLPDTVARPFGIPLNPLPILMAATSFWQIKSMPQTGDATMRRVMMFMPLMFLFFCYSYGSGLALYWTVGNLFTIAQTWAMKKFGKDDPVPGTSVIDVPSQTVAVSGKKSIARPGGSGAGNKPGRSKK